MATKNKKKMDNDEVSMVRCDTSAGPVGMEFHRTWSPHGYDRVLELFERDFFNGSHLFRVVPNFLVQFDIPYTTDQELKKFGNTPIPDDPQHDPIIPFVEGTISYAGSGDNSRTSQLFISYGPSKSLGTQKWETPLGTVVEGMDNVRKFYAGYGDGPPFGNGPAQGKIHSGRRYVEENFPLLDYIKSCTVQRGSSSTTGTAAHHESVVNTVPKRIREEQLHDTKHHKKVDGMPRLNDVQKTTTEKATAAAGRERNESMTTAFAIFGVFLLVLLLIYGYRNSGRKGSKSS